MTNILFSFLFALSTMSLFFTSFQGNGINRVFVNFPIEIIENNTYVYETGSMDSIYFMKDELTEMIHHYFDTLLPRYTDEYETEIRFLYASDYGYCVEDKCNAVKISLRAKVFPGYTYKKTMIYFIGEK